MACSMRFTNGYSIWTKEKTTVSHHIFVCLPGLERLLPPGAATQLTDPSWLDIQRRMGFPPTAGGPLVPGGPAVSAAGSHLPAGVYPFNLSSDLIAREREKLDRLGEEMHALPLLSVCVWKCVYGEGLFIAVLL